MIVGVELAAATSRDVEPGPVPTAEGWAPWERKKWLGFGFLGRVYKVCKS